MKSKPGSGSGAGDASSGPKYIRTLGSKSLSGFSSGNTSQVPSMSQSPNQGFREISPSTREKPRRSGSAMAGGDDMQPHHISVADVINEHNAGSSCSINSMTNSAGHGASGGGYRAAQACDRCRAKKTRCDGKRPQCSQCAAVGFECKISDKLSRRSFPRGYTETLEERVRELEAENRRLVALCDIKEQQIHLVSKYSTKSVVAEKPDERMLQELSSANGGALRASSTNLYLLNKTRDNISQDSENHLMPKIEPGEKSPNEGVSAKDSNAGIIISSVSTNLNDPTSVSFEQNEAPGLPAVKALTSMSTREQSTQLATLVALSVPRSTEEILFIPQLLAKIRQIHGFTSKQCLYTVSVLSSLKTNLPEPQLMKWDSLDYLKLKNLWEIDDLQKFLEDSLKFDITGKAGQDSICLSLAEIDELVQTFFDTWSPHIPILNREEFFSYYDKFKNDTKNNPSLKSNPNFTSRSQMISYKIFACILFVLCQMGLLVKVKNENLSPDSRYSKLTSYYHRAINLIYVNPYFSSLTTSLQALQFLSLSLFYFLNVGNVSAIYELRGRVVSMTQQLRLHRCPSAVLGGSGSTMNKREQGDRRVLFWGIYYLDVFSALQLGVPRLLKDFEIECALPVADNDDKKVSLAGQMIRLEGCVSQFSLAVIRFAKVLGNILDSIFKRGMTEFITKEVALIHENALDNWRRGLPLELMFEIDVNGTINMDEFNRLKQTNAAVEHLDTMILLTLYFLAKAMIHLPVVATKRLTLGNEASGESADSENLENSEAKGNSVEPVIGSNQGVRSSSSYVLLQQATNTMLNVLESIRSVYLPLPINVARTKARFALLSSRGLLEYIKGGALFLDNKTLLLDVVKDIEEDRKLEIPGIISWHSLKLLDMTINLLLQPPNTKVDKLDKLLKKKLNYYNRLMGRPLIRSPSVSQNNSKRKFECESDNTNNDINANLTPVSSKDEKSPPDKMIKIEHDENGSNLGNSQTELKGEYEERQKNIKKPVSTQTAIAEAFQLDPVLNSNLLSDTDLVSFFAGDHGSANILQGNANEVGYEQNGSANGPLGSHYLSSDPKNQGQAPHEKPLPFNDVNAPNRSSNALDGLFRVPSNADFLNDEYYFPGNSQLNFEQYNQQNLANSQNPQGSNRRSNSTIPPNSGVSFSNVNLNSLFGHMNNDSKRSDSTAAGTANAANNSNSSGFNFAVDASLGLAPLLAWTPDLSRQNTTATNHNSDTSDRTGIVLDTLAQSPQYARKNSIPASFPDKRYSDQHAAGERSYTNVSSLEQHEIPTLASHGNRRQSATLSDTAQTNNEYATNEILTLSSRRRPRRRQMSYSQEQLQRRDSGSAPNLDNPPASQPHRNYQDLFDWQNSK